MTPAEWAAVDEALRVENPERPVERLSLDAVLLDGIERGRLDLDSGDAPGSIEFCKAVLDELRFLRSVRDNQAAVIRKQRAEIDTCDGSSSRPVSARAPSVRRGLRRRRVGTTQANPSGAIRTELGISPEPARLVRRHTMSRRPIPEGGYKYEPMGVHPKPRIRDRDARP